MQKERFDDERFLGGVALAGLMTETTVDLRTRNGGMPMRFVVFDDAPSENQRGWTADELAAGLRAPLAAIGVRVVRQQRSEGNSKRSGFQAHGISAKAYKAKSEKVRSVLESLLNFSADERAR
jgi:hypothetical protein